MEPLWKKAKKVPPIYDYRCSNKDCRKEYEYFHSSSEDKIPKCPHCGHTHAKKLVSKGTDFQLKGSGWAKDRYR